MSLPKIIDNGRRKLSDTLSELCDEYEDVSIATGYWDLPGTQLLIEKLEGFKKVRLLIGQEPLAPRYKKQSPETDFPDKDIFDDLQILEQTNNNKELIATIREMIDADKLEVRIYRKSFFHAKAYIFGTYQSAENIAIVGSSNFTRAGLTGNTELNGLESEGRIIRSKPITDEQEVGHLYWFDHFWEQADEWSGKFSNLLSTSPVGDVMFSPYDMYISTLYRLYNDELVGEEYVGRENSLYEFQRRNANILIKKLNNFKLAMLADSVGLGKTITAGSVIDHYLNHPDGRQRVEIIVPAALKTQWSSELSSMFGLHDISIISLQNEKEIDLRQRIDKDAQVKLFVIDEAHNLRSESGSRYKRMFDWLSNNPNSHVLLLTATPINNQLSDFANQIQLAAKGSRSSFKILYSADEKEAPRSRDFDEVIRSLDSSIKAQAKQGKSINFNKVKRALRPVLSHFMVRATRQGIEATYGGLVDKNGITHRFPKSKVDSLPYDFTSVQAEEIKEILFAHNGTLPIGEMYAYSLEELLESTQRAIHPLRVLDKPPLRKDEIPTDSPFDLIFQLILSLGLPMYRDMLYAHRYYGKTIDELRAYKLEKNDAFRLRLQMSIHNIIRIGYLKRLESSPASLVISITRYQKRLIAFRNALDQGKLLRVKDIDMLATEYSDDESFKTSSSDNEELIEITEETHNIEELKKDIDLDLKLLDCALQCANVLSQEDKKLAAFANHITNLQNTQPAGKKVLVFSFYADTIEYLKQRLPEMTGNKINPSNAAFVSGSSRNMVEDYTRRFAPKAKNYELTPLDTELDYLFSTDVLSEGQNLQDCGMLINYDLHWNPVRMIQRNGRINRLGSQFETVYVYNMHPAHQLEQYLRLVQRLRHKIDLIRNTIGTDQPIMGEKAAPVDFLDDAANEVSVEATLAVLIGTEEEKQLSILKLEEEADFSLGEDLFITDLRKFHDTANEDTKNRVYFGIPKGKWGMLPKLASNDKAVPEAISLVSFDILSTNDQKLEIIGGHSRFFASKPTTGTFEAYDTLVALSQIQTTPADNETQYDRIAFDKTAIASNITKYGQLLATSEYQSPRTNKIKPSYNTVLDYMVTRLNMDVGKIYTALSEGSNRIYLKELEKGMRNAHERIKANKPLTDGDINLIMEPSNKLSTESVGTPVLENMEIILNYASH